LVNKFWFQAVSPLKPVFDKILKPSIKVKGATSTASSNRPLFNNKRALRDDAVGN